MSTKLRPSKPIANSAGDTSIVQFTVKISADSSVKNNVIPHNLQIRTLAFKTQHLYDWSYMSRTHPRISSLLLHLRFVWSSHLYQAGSCFAFNIKSLHGAEMKNRSVIDAEYSSWCTSVHKQDFSKAVYCGNESYKRSTKYSRPWPSSHIAMPAP